MPELPEVETIVRDLAPRLVGRTLKDPELFHSDVLRGVSKKRLLGTLSGNRIVELSRRAKHAVFSLESGHRMVIQPGMTGALLITGRSARPSAADYVVLRVGLERGERLLYRDVRRLGRILLLTDREWKVYTSRIGPEPLAADFGVEEFARRIGASSQAIKKVLMDQRRIAGVGNIYAAEALFRAGIDPSRPANRLDRSSLERLFLAVREVLSEAITGGGTTFRDYRRGTGEPGGFQFSLRVYGRGGQPCVRCGASLVTTHAIDGRATTFCWRCQGGRPARRTR
ncbi:MAG: formamidopyrimidine-DNA glycosylase [Gemmatimonadales bacterium]|nr:Formamidopyrimidine-DNA glycosylase [bacterium HR33]GIW52529.1 MAG: formamidopyrimidine-DNA glycosylase [Gemmatimonadales bacterium]